MLGQWKSILYDGLNGTGLNTKRPPSLSRVNEPGLLRPMEFMVLSLMNGEFAFIVIVANLSYGAVENCRARLGLVPDRSLASVLDRGRGGESEKRTSPTVSAS